MSLAFLVLFVSISFATDVWIVADNNILKSSNDGVSFTALNVNTSSVLTFIVAKSATEVWAVGQGGTILVSTNGGSTWTAKSVGISTDLNIIFWQSSTTGFLGGTSYLGKTTDSGSTFTQIAGESADSLYFVDVNNGWLVKGQNIRRTTNGGTSWSAVTTPTNTGLTSIAFSTASNGVAVGLGGKILRTTDGSTWNAITSPTVADMNYVYFSSSTTGFICHISGVLRSTDSGATWSSVTTGVARSIAFVGTSAAWVVGGSLKTSTDGGATWISQTNPYPSGLIRGVTAFGPLSTTTTTTSSSSSTTAPASLYQVDQYYSQDLTCGGSVRAMFITQPTSCTPSSCTNVNGMFGKVTTCQSSTPSYPSGWSAAEIWDSSSSCSGKSLGVIVAPANSCTGLWQFSTLQLNCSSNQIMDCGSSVASCSGCAAKTATSGGSCIAGNPTTSFTVQSYKWWCPGASTGNVCFHKDTSVTYNGRRLTLNELQSHEECWIPHIVRAYGVVVRAKCEDAEEKIVGLTANHLLYTQHGLKRAGELVALEDFLFGDLLETKKCRVTSVETELLESEHFGLNCLKSQVLANGIKASTFETLHSIPSIWMRVVGHVFGIKRASQIGDAIAEIFAKVKWL